MLIRFFMEFQLNYSRNPQGFYCGYGGRLFLLKDDDSAANHFFVLLNKIHPPPYYPYLCNFNVPSSHEAHHFLV